METKIMQNMLPKNKNMILATTANQKELKLKKHTNVAKNICLVFMQ